MILYIAFMETKKRHIISVYPDPESDLKARLVAISEKRRRSLNQQILIMLEDQLELERNLYGTGGNLPPEIVEILKRVLPSFGGKIKPRYAAKKKEVEYADAI